jgi:hypothetical protein
MPYKSAEDQRQAIARWRLNNPDYNKGKRPITPRKYHVPVNYPASYIIYSPHPAIIHTTEDDLTDDYLFEVSIANKNKLISYGGLWFYNGVKIKWIQVRKLLYA